jgi:hypothetical protein
MGDQVSPAIEKSSKEQQIVQQDTLTVQSDPIATDTPEKIVLAGDEQSDPPIYSVLSERQRSLLLLLASFIAAISPASTTTYYPAVTTLARDLNVSMIAMNLSISVYQVSKINSN